MNNDQRLYEIACKFPALYHKGVHKGDIPGITPTDFYDLDLADWLYEGSGRALSRGEIILLEALLNLCNPYRHPNFNMGDAVRTLCQYNMKALLDGIVRMYNQT